MARPLRVDFDGAWHHVMNRGAEGRQIFLAEADRIKFLALIGEASEIFRLEVHAYCLMDNHYHLLVRTPDAGLSRAMRHLNGVYTQHLNRRTERDGALFRGRYRAVLVDSDAYQLQVSRYIHLNPVDAGIVDHPEDYSHSSYRAYLELQTAPEWLITTTVLDHFGSNSPRQEYRRFVEKGIDPETLAFYELGRMGPVFGGNAFKTMIRGRVEAEQRHTDREIPDARQVGSRPRLTAITVAVAAAFGIDSNTLRSTTRRREANVALARCTALYLGRHETGLPLHHIAARLGYASYNSAATALTRFRPRLEESALRAKLKMARSLLYKVET
jgi:REP element-mobilizing transposase RayT